MIKRQVQGSITEALNRSRAVLIAGPRQSGKSTLARHLAQEHLKTPYISLDDQRARRAATTDPINFIADLRPSCVIDEAQRAPELLLEIKRVVDIHDQPGQFLLTGSTNPWSDNQILDSLAGRVELIELFPFSQAELQQANSNLIDRLFSQEVLNDMGSPTLRKDVQRIITTGGFPEFLHRATNPRSRGQWVNAYLRALVNHDMRDLAQIQHSSVVPRLIALAAARSGGLLNTEGLARDLQLSPDTVRRYLQLLETLYLVYRLPAWHKNIGQRIIKAPKLYLVDSGLTAQLANINENRFINKPELFGMLLESFAVMELRKLLTWSETSAELYHWRTASGREVDCVLERSDGTIVAIEIKATATVSKKDISGILALRDELGDPFIQGVVLCTSDISYPVSERIRALPISALWEYS